VSRPPRQSPAREAVARLPSRARSFELLPSGRSIALGVTAAIVAVLAFAAARETSVFAVRTIEVRGVDPKLARHVDAVLAPLQGVSLLKIRSDQVERLATSLPSVAGVTYDRAFPNTLRVIVQAEEPAAVVRHGAHAWLVSRRGRLMERIAQRTHRTLPRIWLAQPLGVPVGATLAAGAGAEEVALIDGLRGEALSRQVRSVRQVDGQWTYVLRGGVQIRVGDRSDLALKLTVAAAILRRTPIFGYLDVSVPQRPVAHENSQVSG
jgi:cell division protein FtsQ